MKKGKNKNVILISFTFLCFIFFINFISAWNFLEKDQFNFPSSQLEIQRFLDLKDTPSSYAGEGTNCLIVNAGETAIEFGSCGSGSVDKWVDNGTFISPNSTFADNIRVHDITAGNITSFGNTHRLDAPLGNQTLTLDSGGISYSCLELLESGHYGFRICNDGAGSNRLVFSSYEDGTEWFWIDRDDGTINFLNTTNFVGNIDVSGNVTIGGDLNVTGTIYNSLSHMHGLATAIQTVAVIDTWYNVTFNSSLGDMSNLQFVDNRTLIIDHDGHYTINFGCGVMDISPLPNANVGMRITNNGNEISGSYVEVDTTKQNSDLWIEHTTHAELSAGDKLNMQYIASDTDVTMQQQDTYAVQGFNCYGYLQEIIV